MTIVVTGGAGFIGSNLVRALERRGDGPLLVVDEDPHERRFRALTASDARYLPKGEFLDLLEEGRIRDVDAILHQGASTSTTATNWRAIYANNVDYSLRLLRVGLARRIPVVYASSAAVYGCATRFSEDGSCDAPVTEYGLSKSLVDRAVRRALPRARSQVVGLRYFNVYGPGETHKGAMASMVFRLHRQLAQRGTAQLFRGSGGYGDGEQRRDHTHVHDVVSVALWFLDRPDRSGIFNVGTGRGRSFNEVARLAIAAHGGGQIDYVPMPAGLRDRYQSFTEADLTALRAQGCGLSFRTIEDAVPEYVQTLRRERHAA